MNERQNEPLLNVTDIVKRAKIALNLQKDSELAEYLGVARGTLSNWCARNSIDFPLLLNKLKDVDYNWLLTGKGAPEDFLRQRRSARRSGDNTQT